MNKTTFHPEAESRFNQEANRIHGLIESRLIQEPPKPKVGLEVHAHNIPEGVIIGPTTAGLVTPDGRSLAIYRKIDGMNIGYFDNAYKELDKFVYSIFRQSSIHNLVTHKELLNSFFEWSINKHLNNLDNNFVDTMRNYFDPLVKEHEIWFPLNGLMVTGDINIGNVSLKAISKTMLSAWETSCVEASKVSPDVVKLKFQKHFQPLQGYAAGVTKRFGTRERATEIASDDIQKIIEIIRAFQFPAMKSGVRSHLALKGQELTPIDFHFSLAQDGCPRIAQSIIGPAPMEYVIDQDQATLLSKAGVWYACGWLFRKRMNSPPGIHGGSKEY